MFKGVYIKIGLIVCFGLLAARLGWLTVVKGEEYVRLSQGNRIRVLREPAVRGIIMDRQDRVLVRNTPEGRRYLFGGSLAHVLGYIREAGPEEILSRPEELAPGDLTGKSGIEKQYDSRLGGTKSERLVEVEADGTVVREMGRKPAIPGSNLKLTVDAELQRRAGELLGDQTGAVVITRPDGAVLALVSRPSFDPNLFTLSGQNQSEMELVLSDERQPLFDRAIAGLYPPGSTFKIVTATAGLMGGQITAETEFEDVGNLCFGAWCFGNWYFLQYGQKEGMVNLAKAIQRSNDIYFYQVGQLTGIRRLADWAKNYGLAQPAGIDLPGEESGLFPTEEWKEKTKGEGWYLGDTLITSIGQGDILTTPLQVNGITRAMAAGGQLCPPHLLDAVQPPEGEKWEPQPAGECRELGIAPEQVALIKQGMKLACEPGGTGWPMFKLKIINKKLKMDKRFISLDSDEVEIPTACKTGTAETGLKSDTGQDLTHAWFTVMAPADDPEIVVTVLIEKGGEGSSVAGPVARDIIKYYFENK